MVSINLCPCAGRCFAVSPVWTMERIPERDRNSTSRLSSCCSESNPHFLRVRQVPEKSTGQFFTRHDTLTNIFNTE